MRGRAGWFIAATSGILANQARDGIQLAENGVNPNLRNVSLL